MCKFFWNHAQGCEFWAEWELQSSKQITYQIKLLSSKQQTFSLCVIDYSVPGFSWPLFKEVALQSPSVSMRLKDNKDRF